MNQIPLFKAAIPSTAVSLNQRIDDNQEDSDDRRLDEKTSTEDNHRLKKANWFSRFKESFFSTKIRVDVLHGDFQCPYDIIRGSRDWQVFVIMHGIIVPSGCDVKQIKVQYKRGGVLGMLKQNFSPKYFVQDYFGEKYIAFDK